MPTPPARTPKLLDQARERARLKHYAIRTEEAYIGWIKRFILFHNKRHPNQMGVAEIEAFLAHLAAYEHVAPSTQNQALAALLFLYRDVLNQELERPVNVPWTNKPKKLPTVLSPDEAHAAAQSDSHYLHDPACKSREQVGPISRYFQAR